MDNVIKYQSFKKTSKSIYLMELITAFIIALVSFLGLVIGMFLPFCNKDELKSGRKYIIFMQKIILAAIIIRISYYYDFSSVLLFLTIALSFLLFIDKIKIKTQIIYPLLGIILYLSSKTTNLFVLISALIFLFGLPSGILIKTNEKGKIEKGFFKKISKNLGFFICIILFLLF